MHRHHHSGGTVQLASLYSIKTGACPEDCKYCPQSAHYAKSTGLKREDALDVDEVSTKATIAKEAGATRFCMGAAWREVKDGQAFDRVLAMVRGVRELDMEACVTLGMLNQVPGRPPGRGGLTAYNHNLDTSAEFYGEIVTTRLLSGPAGYACSVCGAQASRSAAAASSAWAKPSRTVPGCSRRSPISIRIPKACRSTRSSPCRHAAGRTARRSIRSTSCAWLRRRASLMPQSRVRLSAGRRSLSREAQVLCFLAGANSIFYGDKLLTTANNDASDDLDLIEEAGLRVQAPSTPGC